MNKQLNLAHGEVLPTLVKFTVPILLSILLQTTYGTADLLIVGQFASVGDLSGVTIGSQLMQAVTAFCTGLSMGTTILIARYIGSSEKEKAAKVVGVSIAFFALVALVFTLLITIFNDALITIMQTPTESIAQAKSYLFYAGLGALFIVLYNLLGSIFKGIGDSKTPLITVFIACIVNIVLDLVLVAVFNFGATGAAIATVTAQGVSVILSIFIIKQRGLPFAFSKKEVVFDKEYIKDILVLGTPIALQGCLVSASFLVITSIINVFGVVASASVGIVSKISNLIMVVPQAFMQALSSFAAQNLGAQKPERAKQALKYSIIISLIFGVITAYLSAFHGTIFTRLFTSDEATTLSALEYLKSYSIDCILVAVMFSCSGYFNGCGKTTFVMFQSVSGAFLIRIPVAYFLSTLENTNLFIIGLATPSSTLMQIVLCIFYYRHLHKRKYTL